MYVYVNLFILFIFFAICPIHPRNLNKFGRKGTFYFSIASLTEPLTKWCFPFHLGHPEAH